MSKFRKLYVIYVFDNSEKYYGSFFKKLSKWHKENIELDFPSDLEYKNINGNDYIRIGFNTEEDLNFFKLAFGSELEIDYCFVV